MSASLLELGRYEFGLPLNARGRDVAPVAAATLASVAVTPGVYYVQMSALIAGGTPADDDHGNIRLQNTGDAVAVVDLPVPAEAIPTYPAVVMTTLVNVLSVGNLELQAIANAGAGTVYVTSLLAVRVR